MKSLKIEAAVIVAQEIEEMLQQKHDISLSTVAFNDLCDLVRSQLVKVLSLPRQPV